MFNPLVAQRRAHKTCFDSALSSPSEAFEEMTLEEVSVMAHYMHCSGYQLSRPLGHPLWMSLPWPGLKKLIFSVVNVWGKKRKYKKYVGYYVGQYHKIGSIRLNKILVCVWPILL